MELSKDNSLGGRLGRFADRWWLVFLILFGAVFIFGLPFHHPSF